MTRPESVRDAGMVVDDGGRPVVDDGGRPVFRAAPDRLVLDDEGTPPVEPLSSPPAT